MVCIENNFLRLAPPEGAVWSPDGRRLGGGPRSHARLGRAVLRSGAAGGTGGLAHRDGHGHLDRPSGYTMLACIARFQGKFVFQNQNGISYYFAHITQIYVRLDFGTYRDYRDRVRI